VSVFNPSQKSPEVYSPGDKCTCGFLLGRESQSLGRVAPTKWDIFLVAIIFLSLICVFYSHVIFLNEMFIKRDIGRYYHPLRYLVRQIFESGEFPLWNPYLFCGLPLFATLQSCVLYPVSIICYLGEFSRMLNIFILFHLFLGGIFMYLLMREWKLSKLASFFAAFSFAFSGYMISAINLTISLTGTAWFPLLLYFYGKTQMHTDKGIDAHRYRWVVFSALVLVMMLLAGDPAIVFMSIIILGCISFYFFLEDIVAKKRFSITPPKLFFITAALFLVLSVFQTLPFLEFLRLTDRKDMGWLVASGWSVPPTDLISLVIPFFNDINWYFGDYWQVQSWLDNYYMGIIPLFLCFVGAFFDKTKKRSFLILFFVCGLAISLGRYTAFYALLYKFFPLFRFIRYPVRFFFLVAFSIAALSGIGLDYFRNNIKNDARLKRFGGALFVASFAAVLGLFLMISFPGTIFVKLWNAIFPMLMDHGPGKSLSDLYTYIYMDFYNFKRALTLFIVFGFMFFLGTKRNVRQRSICFAFIGITLCDVVATNTKYEATMNIKNYNEPAANIKFLRKDEALFRIAVSPAVSRLHMRLPENTYYEGVLASKDRLVSNRMVEYGIYDIAGYDSMYLSRQNRLLGIILRLEEPGETRIMDMLNVKYICTGAASVENKKGYKLANKGSCAYLFRNLNWMPRAYFAQNAVIIKDEDKIIERLKDVTFDPAKEVILEERVPYTLHPTPYTQSTPDIITYKPNEVIIKASVDLPKFLILADSYYPGWKVYVDGVPDRIYRANYILRAVYLKEPGEHIVKFIYRPFSFKLGIGISLLGLVFAALLIRQARERS
jgi:hypothetical protein